MTPGKNDKPNGRYDNTTFLYIRTHPADDGTTPLPPGLQFWLSPDIAIIRPDGSRGTEAEVGEFDQVEVMVTNDGGIDALNASVEVFLADPSTAFTPATSTSIGTGYLSVPNHSIATITFPWTPVSVDAGHRCMLARVSLLLPFDGYVNPAIFDVVGDRHVAQRNLNVAHIEGDTLSFGFLVTNPLGQDGHFLLRAAEIRGKRVADVVRGALGCPFAQLSDAPLGGAGLTLAGPVPPQHERMMTSGPVVGVLRKPLAVPRNKSHRLIIRADEPHYAMLTVARNSAIRTGDLSVVQVEQIDIQTKRTVGGIWLIVYN